MKKTKFLLIALFALLGLVPSSAEEKTVTFDFTAADSYTMFGLTGFSSNSSTAGDFTTAKEAVKDGVTLTVYPKTSGTNETRLWGGNPNTLRIYKGKFTVSATGTISKIVVTYSETGDVTATPGSYNTGTWTGSATDVELNTISKWFVKTVAVTYDAPAAPVGGDDEVANYLVDFNESISTSAHDFVVANKWGHIVGSGNYDGYGPYYMSYSYSTTAGVGGTGTLKANRQYAGDNGGGTVCYDLLVTPLVKGTISLKVKADGCSSSNPAFVEFYSLNAEGTERVSLLKTAKEEIPGYNSGSSSDHDWVTVSLEVADYQRIGIRAQYVYLDDFNASFVKIVKEAGMNVTAVMNEAGQTGYSGKNPTFAQQADGKMKVDLWVDLKNTGDFELKSGVTENYTLTLGIASSASGSKTYYDDATINVPVDIAVGATASKVPVTFFVPYVSGYKYYFVRENVTGTTSSTYRYATSAAYESKYVFRLAGNTSTSSLSGTQAFGVISETTTKQYEIYNDGTAPLTLKSITLPEGFTSADLPAENTVVDSKQKVQFSVTLPADVMGNFSDDLTVVYLNEKNQEKTYTLGFSGAVIPEGTFVADFTSTTSGTVTFPAGSVKEAGVREGTTYISSGNYDGYLYSFTSTSYANENNKFITPLLHANAGEKLTFDVARDGYSGSQYNLKVYVSKDRQNWGEPVFSVTAADLTSDFQNKSITFDKAGDYYVAFAIYCVKLDNVIGLQKVDVAHDVYFKSIKWPGEDGVAKSGLTYSYPAVEIIPLTTEAAANYTLKYYLNDQAVATVSSKALTASATATTNFTFSFTPEVEQTTVFDSYVKFEFTDGSSVESEHFELTVAYEPEFHFYTSLPTSKYNKPTDYTADIVFTKTNQPGEKKSFYIYNYGSAPMQVKSISLPIGFTTTLEAPFTVAAYDDSSTAALATSAQQIDITFAPEFAAEFSGNMHIVYVDGEGKDQTFTLPVSGILLDANKFYANFDGTPVWPAGSVYQKNVSVTTGYVTCSSTTDNLFITPKLHATTGDYLRFDARIYSSYWSEGNIHVYAAETREALLNGEGTELLTVSGEATDEALKMGTDYKTFTLNFPQRGDFFIGFAINSRAQLDEIYGLTTVDVNGDLMLSEATIPAEAMQNVSAIATLKVANVGLQALAAADYKVIAYVDGEATEAEGTMDLPVINKLSESTEIGAAFRSHKAGTFPVYFEVVAGDCTVQTETVNVTFAEEQLTAGEVVVGTAGYSQSRDNAIIDFFNLDVGAKTSDILYTAAQLNAFGITEGATITSLAFKGTISSAKTISNSLTAWVGVQTGDITWNSPDKSAMTEVKLFDGSIAFTAGENIFTIALPEPIVYDGTSDLRVYFEGTKGGWANVAFDYDNNYKNMKWSNNSSLKGNPLLYVTLAAAEPATFSGVVTDGTDPIEGATVTLVSNDGDNIQYTATTDAEGQYTINVIQTAREYTALAYLEKYVDATTTVNFAEGSQTHDFVLASITDLESLKDYANLFKGEKMNKDVRAALVAAAAVEPVAGDPEATLKATKDLKEACDAAVMSLLAYYRVAMIPDVVNNTNVYTSEAYIAYAEAFKPIQAAYKAETLTTEEAEAIGEEWFTNDSPLGQLLLSPWDEESPITMNKYGNLIATGTVTARLNYINEGVYDITALYEAVGEGITFQAVGGEEVELETENIQELMAKAVLAPKGEFTLTFNVPEGSLITFTDLWFELNRAETAEQEKADELDAAKAEWAAAVADLQTALGEAQTLREQSETSKVEEESVNELDAAIAAAELLLGEEVELVTTSDYVNKTKELAAAAKRLRSATIKVKRSITVGISTVMADGLDLNAPMYNAQGKRVNRNYRGIIIQNGQKFNRK